MAETRIIDPGAKRAAIIKAATRLFARNGYDGASTAEIAKDAGVSVGTVFRIFPTKEDLANDIFQSICVAHEKINILAGVAEPSTQGGKESFEQLIKGNVERVKAHPNEFMFFEASFGATYLNSVSTHIAKRIRGQLIDWISYHQSKDLFKAANVDVIFAVTIGGMARLARESIQRKFEITGDIERDFFEMCWRAIAK
jgi:AcrR family transcriptional regulator